MKRNDIHDRIERLEKSAGALSLPGTSEGELIDAMVHNALNPLQVERVFEIAAEDIKIGLVLQAQFRRIELPCPSYKYNQPILFQPVCNAVTILSRPVAMDAGQPKHWGWNPDLWKHPWHKPQAEKNKVWARSYLMDRLIGHDGGLSLRAAIDTWFDGGPAPVDLDRYPDVRTYRLLGPIGDPYDDRLLRIPTPELHEEVKGYYDLGFDEEAGDNEDLAEARARARGEALQAESGAENWTKVDILDSGAGQGTVETPLPNL